MKKYKHKSDDFGFGPKNCFWPQNSVFLARSSKDFPDTGLNYAAYTDGSCDNQNPYRPAGAGYVILKDGKVIKVKSKGFLHTTNNRMEMLAIISACNYLPEGSYVDIYSDSQYAIEAFVSGGKANQDLLALFKRCISHLAGVQFHWVRGHNGDTYNEMADELANTAYKDICKEHNIPLGLRHSYARV